MDVGVSDGSVDGLSESDGMSDGLSDPMAVGIFDTVGLLLGATLGRTEGSLVGTDEGTLDGKLEGSSLGAKLVVGALELDGDDVGSSLRKEKSTWDRIQSGRHKTYMKKGNQYVVKHENQSSQLINT